MRIDKQIERMLKAWVNIMIDSYSTFTDPEFEDWFRQVIRTAIDDPMVDMIAAQNGLVADDLLRNLQVVGRGNLGKYPHDSWEVPEALHYPDEKRIEIEIPKAIFDARDEADVINAFYHELSHVGEKAANFPWEAYPETGSTQERYLGRLTTPKEQRAHKTQILELLTLGYSDEQIVAYMMDTLASYEVWGGEWAKVGPAVEHQVWTWLEQVKADYEDVLV
jgi:hypothetical protein